MLHKSRLPGVFRDIMDQWLPQSDDVCNMLCHPRYRGDVVMVTCMFLVGMIPYNGDCLITFYVIHMTHFSQIDPGADILVNMFYSFNVCCPCNGIVAGASPARCGHSGRLLASDSPVLCVGGSLVGFTTVATRAHELFWIRVRW